MAVPPRPRLHRSHRHLPHRLHRPVPRVHPARHLHHPRHRPVRRHCFEDTWVQSGRVSRALSLLPEDNQPEEQKLRAQPRLWVSLHSSIFRKSPSPSNSQASSSNSVPPRLAVTHKRTFSGGSDRRVLEAERAIERLALERADYQLHRQSLQEIRASVIKAQPPSTPERKEWFDKELEGDLFAESDSHLNENREEVR